MKKLLALFAACLQLIPAAFAAVGDKADFSSLDNVQFFQNKVTSADLQGKVVFIEYWGMQCYPCRMAMPKLQALYDKYKDNGFVLIATHCQLSTPEAINAFFKENKLTFPSCNQFRLPQGQPQGGIPFSVLVGCDGKVVDMGSPTKVEESVAGEIKKMMGGLPILNDVKLNKYKKMQTTVLEGAPNIDAKIAPLRAKTDDEEAQQICQAYDTWLERRKNALSECRQRNAFDFVTQVATLKKSVPSMTDFDDDVTKLTADPTYVKLNDMRKKVKAMRKKLDDGKKVSPKAIENMISSLSDVPQDDAGIFGSARKMRGTLLALEEDAKEAATAKKTKDTAAKADRKKRNSR